MYNDEGLLPVEDYEKMAKAYANMLKQKGLKIINIQEEIDQTIIHEIFDKLLNIKSLLFAMGGFLNTSRFYSLNERHINKLSIMFDYEFSPSQGLKSHDKTKCFLSFTSCEFALIKLLLSILDKTVFERDIKNIINDRLSLISQILAL